MFTPKKRTVRPLKILHLSSDLNMPRVVEKLLFTYL
jgi:hypothetical protein